ncbi:hypothetical protein [Kozakia baliensis]|uniref:hypothetical protein n=1 Tax=Kozakia baliensis TaxID=153496 RepID=UPI00089DAD17|nr:hypothetical protein [Kozakia baliensis]
MAQQLDLFGYVKPRKPRRILAHAVDVGDHGGTYGPGMTMIAFFSCKRCGWCSPWQECCNMTTVKRGIACLTCNDVQQTAGKARVELTVQQVADHREKSPSQPPYFSTP